MKCNRCGSEDLTWKLDLNDVLGSFGEPPRKRKGYKCNHCGYEDNKEVFV